MLSRRKKKELNKYKNCLLYPKTFYNPCFPLYFYFSIQAKSIDFRQVYYEYIVICMYTIYSCVSYILYFCQYHWTLILSVRSIFSLKKTWVFFNDYMKKKSSILRHLRISSSKSYELEWLKSELVSLS